MNYLISRRNFGLLAGLGSVSAAAAVNGFISPAQAQTISAQRSTLMSIGNKAGTSHTFVTHNDGRVTIHLLDAPSGLIIVDSGDAGEYSEEVLAMANSLGKDIAGVIVSHDHPDHTGGLNSYKGLPIFTSQGILDNIKNGPFKKPENVDEIQALDGDEMSMAGLTLKIHNYKNAEAKEQIVIEVPEMSTAIVQDLVYNNCYMFPGMDRTNWIAILEELNTKLDAENILVGHGYPSSQGELTAAVDYLNEYQRLISESADADDLVAKYQARYPNLMGEGLLGLQKFAFN